MSQRGFLTELDEVFSAATVLIVDDHQPNVSLLSGILGRAGAVNIHSTLDPTAAPDLYQRIEPDLVLLDLHMPGMDGFALMDKLASMTAGDDFVPMIVLTADSTPDVRERALEKGAHDFLTKPFERTEVVLRARNLLRTRAMHQRLRRHNVMLAAEIEAHRADEARTAALQQQKTERIGAVLADGAVQMVFQPVADLASGEAVGYEALARFETEPRRAPDVWFAEATEVGLGVELELGAVRAALAAWPRLPEGAFLSVNLSPEAAVTTTLAELITSEMAPRVILEITEHAAVDDYDALQAALDPLRRAGVRLAIDDAGAGFASLRHILKLCPDIIKLDITLTRDLDKDPVKRALAAALVTFAGELGARIIAEGIESEDEGRALAGLGIVWGQGYFIARPGPLPDPTERVDASASAAGPSAS